jgi:hypothetical protein
MAVLFTVLGAWGVYDYAVKIPRQQMLTDRLTLLELCRAGLETEQSTGEQTPEAREALLALNAEIQRLINEGLAEPGETMTLEEYRQRALERAQALPTSEEGQWVSLLTGIAWALKNERRIPLTPEAYPQANAAYEATNKWIEDIGVVTAPHKFDRVTQWAFISCLPFGPWFLWSFWATKRRVYTLDEEGTLAMPEGTWKREEIADIDMDRWMAKSVAWVVHRDGARVKLDDYKHRDLHKIIGSIAHRLHPDDWDAEARPADAETDAGEAAQVTGSESPGEATPAAVTPSDAH